MPADASLSLIAAPDLGGAPASATKYYAFNTDSPRALVMLHKLAGANVKVYRTVAGFTLGGKKFPTGTAILDGSTVTANGINPETYSDTYQTPIAGMSVLPSVNRYLIKKPKLAMLTGTTAVTRRPPAAVTSGPRPCQAMFVLREKLGLPGHPGHDHPARCRRTGQRPVHGSRQPGHNVAAGAGATALQTFVNNGGSYFSWGTGGATSLVTPVLTNVNTTTNGTTDGVPVKVNFNTNSPLSWGFDNGGFSTASPVRSPQPDHADRQRRLDPERRRGGLVPEPDCPVLVRDRRRHDQLVPARPPRLIRPSPGRVTLLSIDPTFRAWLEGPSAWS